MKRVRYAKLVSKGEKIDQLTKSYIKIINEGFGSIKDTLYKIIKNYILMNLERGIFP